jgi:hypothetical protein
MVCKAVMKPRLPSKRLRLAILVAAALELAACSTLPVITITNRSTVTLTTVMISGSGFSERIESLAPDAAAALTVRPHGESGLRVIFDAGERHVDVDDLAYLEGSGGYRVVVTVQPLEGDGNI